MCGFSVISFVRKCLISWYILQDCNIRDSLQYEKPIQFVFPLRQLQREGQQNNFVPELPKVSDFCFKQCTDLISRLCGLFGFFPFICLFICLLFCFFISCLKAGEMYKTIKKKRHLFQTILKVNVFNNNNFMNKFVFFFIKCKTINWHNV